MSIRGIGVDSVEINRFSEWNTYSEKKLSRIFSEEEIEYCLRNTQKSAERFAVRFAAKEAFLKAFSSAFPDISLSLLTVCRSVFVRKDGERPVLHVEWNKFITTQEALPVCHLSLTHTQAVATAFVVIENITAVDF